MFGSMGGAETNIFATASALSGRGHVVGLLARRSSGRGEEAWHELFGKELFFSGQESAGRVALRFQANLIYVHKWDDLPGMEELRATGIPMARMVHDHDIYCLRSYRYSPVTRRICTRPAGFHCVVPCLAPLQRNHSGPFPFQWSSFALKQRELALSRRFDCNFVATQFMKHELLINGFDPSRIEVCAPAPRPVDPLTSTFSSRNLLVFAGQVIRGKGVDVLLRALSKVRAPFEAIILGDGNHRGYCEKLSHQLRLEGRVKFQGFVPQEELQQFYREATAVLFPSVWPEPMGLAGIEAMRNGLPVVAFDVGGVGEWLTDGETGWLVEPMNIRMYAEKIDSLLADKKLARAMGARGFARFERDFEFADYIAILEALLQRVAHERKVAA